MTPCSSTEYEMVESSTILVFPPRLLQVLDSHTLSSFSSSSLNIVTMFSEGPDRFYTTLNWTYYSLYEWRIYDEYVTANLVFAT